MSAKQLVVGAVVVDDFAAPTKVLAARRLGGRPSVAGRWEFPGGKVDPGETPQEALVRELREELDFEAELGIEIINPAAPTWPITDRLEMRIWLARAVDDGPTLGHVHSEIRWLEPEGLHRVDWLAADVAVLERLRVEIGWGPQA